MLIFVNFQEDNVILSDPAVTNRMWQSWTNTLANTFNNSRREEGYFITFDTATKTYGIDGYLEGPFVPNNTNAFVFLGPTRPPDSITNPTPLDKPVYVVGWFHTHTPTFYLHWIYLRGVGPTKPHDFNYSAHPFINVPGFVIDYTPANADDEIPGGHPLDAEATIYTITPPKRRPLP